MQTDRTQTPCIQAPETLIQKLAARQSDSALAAPSRRAFLHASDDFVAPLSADAKAFLAQLQTPASNNRPNAVPPVPPALGEELFAFADYGLLTELRQPALEAIMRAMTVPSALRLLLACHSTHREHDRGYTDLKHGCQAYLARHTCVMANAPEYQRLEPHQKAKVNRALAQHTNFVLQGGFRSELPPLQDAILRHIDEGLFCESYLDKPHVFAWLCNDASVATWEALAAKGHPMQRLTLHRRAAAFRLAARAGRTDLVDAIWKAIPPRKRDALWTSCDHGALRYAIAADNPAMVATLLAHLTPIERGEASRSKAVWNAAVLSPQSGMVRILRLWLPHDFLSQYEALQTLVEAGDNAAVADLLFLHPNQRKFLSANDCEIFRLACGSGHLNTVRALLFTAIQHIDMLLPILHQGLLAASKNAMAASELQAIVAALEDAARPYGWDIFTDFGHRPLAQACEHGHTQVVRHVLGRMHAQGLRTFLQMRADLMGRQRSLLAAACGTAQRAVVGVLLDCADAVGGKAALVLADNGAALRWATNSGDNRLVQQLIAIAAQNPEAWASWKSDENLQGVLRWAVASNHVDVLQTWLDVIPNAQHRAALLGGQLVFTALQMGSNTTLEALFDLAVDDAALTTAFLDEAVLADEGLPAIACALRGGHTRTADTILNRIGSESRRMRVLTTCFQYLCQTDLTYFRSRWEGFTRQQREALLTPHFWAYLPLQAGADVAAYLVHHHTAAFAKALAPLPEGSLHARECEAVHGIIAAAPIALQARILEAWGNSLLRTAIENRSCETWKFVRQGLGRDGTLALLVDQRCKLFTEAYGSLKTAFSSFVLLSGQWLDAPQTFGALGQLAIADMVSKDNVTLLRELLARYPDVRRHPHLECMLAPLNALWATRKPQITLFLLDTADR